MEFIDKDKMNELLKKLQPEIFRIVSFRVSNPEDAKDITQEALIRVFQHIQDFYKSSPKASVHTWVYQIAKNLCIDYYRRKKNKNNTPIDTVLFLKSKDDVEDHVNNIEFNEKLHQALTHLPSFHRTVFIMKYIDDLSIKEIANQLNIPINTVKSYIHRAKKSLQPHLVNYIKYAS